MSSDFWSNKRRVDIKLNCTEGYTTWKQVIEAVLRGEKVIKTTKKSKNLPKSVWKDGKCLKVGCYSNSFCRQLRKLGIVDIRYGSMDALLGGDGYTLYKPKIKKGNK